MPHYNIKAFLSFNLVDVRTFGRAAWKAAQGGGFSNLAEWREHRREKGIAAVVAELAAEGIPLRPDTAGIELIDYR